MLERIKKLEKETLKKIYVIAMFAIMAIPFVLFFIFPSNSTTENKKLSERPVIIDESGFNLGYMQELSKYFEDRFAFRTYMVDINSRIRADIFKTSPEDDVIVGKNGWLFYASTLDDYLGDNLSTNRELFAMAENVKLMQNYAESKGAKFVFTIAPNKNSLYPEYMPSQYQNRIVQDASDARRLEAFLEQNEVSYVNLFSIIHSADNIYYLKGDSHWNKVGAIKGYNAILDKAEKAHDDYSGVKAEYVMGAAAGDLHGMIYPKKPITEADFVYDKDYTYSYAYCDNKKSGKPIHELVSEKAENEDVTYNEIITRSDNGEGALLMYRDSFGNALIDLFSEEFEKSYFTKLEPYDLSDVDYIGADTVVLEKVERHIQSLCKVAPLMEAVDITENEIAAKIMELVEKDSDGEGEVNVLEENRMVSISGTVPEELVNTTSAIYALVADGEELHLYEAFLINENGYQLYLNNKNTDLGVKLFVADDKEIKVVCDETNNELIVNTINEIKRQEELKQKEALEKAEKEEAERKAKEEAEKKAKEEEERLKAEKEEAEKKKSEKTIVSKVFYEDCGVDTGYYEIVWSDGTVTYQDVY